MHINSTDNSSTEKESGGSASFKHVKWLLQERIDENLIDSVSVMWKHLCSAQSEKRKDIPFLVLICYTPQQLVMSVSLSRQWLNHASILLNKQY